MGRFQGKYGLAIDNLISAQLVTADAKAITVSATENADLFWGLRGAGHNFGIVTSLKMKCYPQTNNGMQWSCVLVFPPPMIAKIIETLNSVEFSEKMAATVFFGAVPPDPSTVSTNPHLLFCSPQTNHIQPSFFIPLWYAGPEDEARQAWAHMLSAGAVFEQSGMMPFPRINDGSDAFAPKGGRRPCTSLSVKQHNPQTMAEVWNVYTDFWTKNEAARHAMIMLEMYSTKTIAKVPVLDTAFPHRAYGCHAVVIVDYTDPAFDEEAFAYARKVRGMIEETSGEEKNHVYVNFALGDEKIEEMYGYDGQVEKLRQLKSKWDPEGRFSYYHSFE